MNTTNKLKVGVLMGGKSSECEVSLATGRYVLNLIDPQEFQGVPIYMDKQGQLWKLPLKLVIMNTTKDVEARLGEAEHIKYETLPEIIDFAFIGLLGKYGEDGAIQGLLELLKIPYTGSGILASAIAMHKRVSKRLLQANGFDVALDISVYKADYEKSVTTSQLIEQINSSFKFPVVVKPVAEGSSVGVTFVENEKSLEAAINEAFRWDDEILIEEYVDGQEFMCVVIGNENPEPMKPSEVEFPGDIFTYEQKYMPGQAVFHTPIRTTEENIKKIQELVKKAYGFLQIKGFGRVDGFLKDSRMVLSEPHTGTIMVPSSYVFQQAALHDNSSFAAMQQAQATKIKAKGGNKFNPRQFITTVVKLGNDAHASKKGVL